MAGIEIIAAVIAMSNANSARIQAAFRQAAEGQEAREATELANDLPAPVASTAERWHGTLQNNPAIAPAIT